MKTIVPGAFRIRDDEQGSAQNRGVPKAPETL